MKTVIATGINGFVGSHFRELLLRKDYITKSLSLSSPSADLHLKNTSDIASIKEFILKTKPSYIFHLAGCTHATNPLDFIKVNQEFGLALLEAMFQAQLLTIPIVMLGSAAEYGKFTRDHLPLKETFQGPVTSLYGATKLGQTHLAQLYAKKGLKTIVIRPSNILGPRLPNKYFLGRLIEEARLRKENNDVTPISTGNLNIKRDFIDVFSFCDVLLRAVQSEDCYGKIINASSGQTTSLHELVNIVKKNHFPNLVTQQESLFIRPDDQEIHYSDPSLLKSLLNVELRIDLEKTIDLMWHKKGNN